MSSARQHDATVQRGSVWQNEGVRRVILYAAVLLAAFLLGLVPMWLTARGRARERDAAQAALRVSTLQNTLSNAAIDVRQGRYEPARLSTSDFFTGLREEIERGRDSVFSGEQQSTLRPVLGTRDDTITLLARSDPASADRLVDLYNKYRQATESAPPR